MKKKSWQNRKKELAIKEQNESILDKMVGESKATEKRDKLKDYQFSLKDKHQRNVSMISFLEKNDECPTCEQQIDKEFKTRSIQVRERDNVDLSEGLTKLSQEMDKVNDVLSQYRKLAKQMQTNEVEIGKYRSTIAQLGKFNARLDGEIEQILQNEINKDDLKKLDKLKEKLYSLDSTSKKLKEELFYYDVARKMLQDTGIKTKDCKTVFTNHE